MAITSSLPFRVIKLLIFSFFLCFCGFAINTVASVNGLSTTRDRRSPIETIFKWKTVAYGPTNKSEKDLINGDPYYIRENIIPTKMVYHEKTGMLFIAAPRIKPGVISTLNSLDLFETYHLLSPIWSPYPSAQMNELKVN